MAVEMFSGPYERVTVPLDLVGSEHPYVLRITNDAPRFYVKRGDYLVVKKARRDTPLREGDLVLIEAFGVRHLRQYNWSGVEWLGVTPAEGNREAWRVPEARIVGVVTGIIRKY